MKKLLFLSILSFLAFTLKKDKFLKPETYSLLTEEEKRKPENALAGIEILDPSLELSLFASEPMMTNPTNMDIDAKGRVWICEAYNYRNKLNPRNPYNKKGDRILILDDTDLDGKADKSTVFYQGEDINAALGIAVLGNKTYVSVSPNMFVFTDLDGDDVPDKKEILFSGVKGEQHDHGLHAVTFGHDGKLYFNFGNAGEGIKDKNNNIIKDDRGNAIDASKNPYQEGMVFRCDEDGSNFEALGWNFRNNYELTQDSYGRMWQSDNDDDGNRGTRINYVMDYGNYGFKDEKTGADWRVRRTNWEDSIPQRHWHLNDPGVVPNMLQTYAGSPTGIVLYEGSLLPATYRNQLLHCDAGPNVMRSYAVTKTGAGFSAKINPLLDGSKNDKWFRPSDVTVAHDGSVFISDWYDPGVGGHAMGDSLRGRIFRLAPKGHKYSKPTLDLNSPEGAIIALNSPNQAIRFLGYQKLKALGKNAENTLKNQLKSAQSHLAARAFWLLAALNTDYILEASKSSNEDLRVLSVRMARLFLKDAYAFYKNLSNDPSIQVKREVALAIRHKNYTDIWMNLSTAHSGQDRWYLEALGIAGNNDWDNILTELEKKNGSKWLETQAVKDFVWRSRGKKTNALLAEIIKNSPEKEKPKYYRAFDFQGAEGKNKALLSLLRNSKSIDEKVLIFKHFDQNSILKDPIFLKTAPFVVSSIPNKLDYLDIVNKYQLKSEGQKIHKLAMTSNDKAIWSEAVKTATKIQGSKGLLQELALNTNATKAIKRYGSVDEPIITNELVKIFESDNLSPQIRNTALEEMAGYNSEEVLYAKLKENKLKPEYLEPALKILKRTWHADIRNEVNKLAANALGTINTEKILNSTGNANAGKETFKAYCISCHLVNNEGADFGPNLSQIGSKLSKQGLLNSVLYPTEGIGFGYEGSIITFKNGNSAQGIITSKTEIDLMVKYPGSAQINILKLRDIVKIEPMAESIMPKFALNETELTDLNTYLETLKK